MADKWTRTNTLNIAPGGTKRQEGFEKMTAEIDSAYERDNTLYKLIQSRLAYRQCVLACSVSDPSTVLGTAQVESLTLSGTVTTAGEIVFTVVGAEFDYPSYSATITVAVGDTSTTVATAIRTVLAAISGVTDLYTVGGSYSTITLTHKEKYTANDSTLCMTVTNSTSAGLELPATSVDSVAGVEDTSGEPDYLTYSGLNVSLEASTDEPVAFSMAYGYDSEGRPVDYIETLTADLANRWTVTANTTAYLYVDRSITSGTLSYGQTTLKPVYSLVRPASKDGLHWFSPATQKMYVYDASASEWVEKIRLFVAKVVAGESAITSLEMLNIVTDTAHDIAAKLDADSPAVGIGTVKVDETNKADGRLLGYDAKTGRIVYKAVIGGVPGMTDYIYSGRKFGAPSALILPITAGVESIAASTISRAANTIALNARSAALIYDDASGNTSKLEAVYPTAYIDDNTVGFWIFNQAAGSVVPNSAVGVSSIAVANDLTPAGTLTRVDGRCDYAIKGDGSSGSYSSANSTNFPTGTNVREIDAVFTALYLPSSTYQFIAMYGTNSSNTNFGLLLYGTRLYISLGSNDKDTGYDLEIGKTYYLAAMYDGTTIYVYVNGALVYRVTYTISTGASSLYVFRLSTSSSYYCKGIVHCIELRQGLRTSAQIAAISNSLLLPCGEYDIYSGSYPTISDSTYYEYKFSESSGLTVADSKGLLGLTATGTTIKNSEIINGGYARYFDGSDDKVASGSSVAFSSAFTMIAVFNPTDFSAARPIFGNYSGGGNYLMAYTNGKVAIGSGVSTVYSSASAGIGKPNFTAVVVSDGQASFFVNSPYVDSTSAYTYQTNSNPMYLGYAYTGSSAYFRGVIDYCLYVPRALSTSEIAAIYNALLVKETRDFLYNLPESSIALGFVRANSSEIIEKNDTDYQYGRREGAVGGNRGVFLGWQYFSGDATLSWDNPFGTRTVSRQYFYAEDATGSNMVPIPPRFYNSGTYGGEEKGVSTNKITFFVIGSNGVVSLNGTYKTSGYVNCYAEVLD
jgi:Mu-like prophage tail sheath protein gpL